MLAAVLVLCLALLFGLRQRALDPIGVRLDSWSEANILVAARNVARHGWARYGGVAQNQVDRPPFANDPYYYYANYPLGTYYLNAALYPGLSGPPAEGDRALALLRWPPALCACATLILWYVLLRGWVGIWIAGAATLVLATSYGFLAFADDIHHGYAYPLVLGLMLGFDRAVRRQRRVRRGWIAVAWLCACASAFISWEWILWSQMFVWGYAIFFGVPFRRGWLLVFALAPALALGAQQNLRARASGDQVGDMVQDLLRRTVRLEETADTPPDVTLRNYPLHVLERFKEFYGTDLLVVVALALLWNWAAGGGVAVRAWHPTFRWMVLLLACSATWWCVMIQHTAVHPHVMRHALLFYALVVGAAISAGLVVLLDSTQPPWARLLATGILALVAWSHASVTLIDIRLHAEHDYSDPRGWSPGWSESIELAEFARKVDRNRIILTNNARLPLLRYWTDVPVYPATLARHPYHRDHIRPESRYRVELTASHLTDLYRKQIPPALFAYWFFEEPVASYSGDPILWQLIDGTWSEKPTPERVRRFSALISGDPVTPAYPILAAGDRWVDFDASRWFANLPAEFLFVEPPTRSEYGPPR